MTFAEMLLSIVAVALLFRVLRPLQRRLETRLYHVFRSRGPQARDPVIIDITDYNKKDQLK
jgi:hypothetical protein